LFGTSIGCTLRELTEMRMAEPLDTETRPDDGSMGQAGAGDRERDLARLRAVFDHTFHYMAVLSPEGRVLDANRAALGAIRRTRDQVLGLYFWEAPWWAGQPEVQERIREDVAHAAGGLHARREVELGRGDDELVFDLSILPVMDGAETPTMLIAEGRDITEAKWAERALRVSEARFAGIISISSEAIVSVDGNFEITHFNQGAEATFGYSASDVLGKPLEMLLPERYRKQHSQHMRHFSSSPVAARRMGERQEIAGLRRDGTEFPAEASISKLDLFGSPVFTVVLRDITARKRVERSQRFLAQAGSILGSSLDYETTLASVAGLTVPELADWSVVYIRDDGGSIRRLEVAHADSALREVLTSLLRYPLDPRSPHPVFTTVENGRPEVMNHVSEEFLDAMSQSEEHRSIYRQLGFGSMMMVPLVARGVTRGAMGFFSARPNRYGADELALAQDLAVLSAMAVDNARLYRDARDAVQARDDLIAVVSHDLGNPLSAIRIGTSLLLKTMPKEELASANWQHLEFIRQSAQQMENLINDLMDVKRLETGRVSIATRPLDVAELVREVREVFRPIAENRALELHCVVGPELPRVAGDQQRLSQVLSNLIGNALKFTEAGGRVTIRASTASDVVVFSVSDTGPGIEPEHQPHVFDRFWQARREGRKGLGLGLAIARGIVDAHGGRIWVESTPGVGTTFLFTIPIAV
jgi:PAS domain S-box-containing protein